MRGGGGPRLALACALGGAILAAGLLTGSGGLFEGWPSGLPPEAAASIVRDIRLPRTLGAMLVGALLGLAGAVAQGLFRNPLADPYLVGSAAGAALAVVLVLALGAAAAPAGTVDSAALAWARQLGLSAAAFAGAAGGVALSLVLAGGAQPPLRLLLAGVVVGVLLGAAADAVTLASPEALRGRQGFLLGSTAFVGWRGVALMAALLATLLPLAWALARALDALALGEDTAASLGLPLPAVRAVLLGALALATGAAVAQAGLVAFVGLAAPHLARRVVGAAARRVLPASAAAGALLLASADVLARGLAAPAEWPVGLVTAVLGGLYLLVKLRRSGPESWR